MVEAQPGGTAERLRDRLGKVHGGAGREPRAAGVLHIHADAGLEADVSDPPCRREATHPADLEADHLAGPVGDQPQGVTEGHQGLVEGQGLSDGGPHGEVLFVGLAGLLHHPVEVTGGVQGGDRLGRRPGPVDVERDLLARGHGGVQDPHPLDVGLYVRADLGRVERVPLGARQPDLGQQLVGCPRRDRRVQAHPAVLASPQHVAERQPGRPCDEVPAGHVNGGLHVAVPWQGEVHGPVDGVGAARVEAEDRWCQFGDAGPDAARERREVCGAPRAALAPAGQSLVGVQAQDRRVEALEVESPTRQGVGPLQGQVQPPHRDPGDPHARPP